jgi:hypothetical protein
MGLDASMLMAPVLFAWLAGGRHTPWWLAVAAVFLVCAALLRPIVGAQGRPAPTEAEPTATPAPSSAEISS